MPVGTVDSKYSACSAALRSPVMKEPCLFVCLNQYLLAKFLSPVLSIHSACLERSGRSCLISVAVNPRTLPAGQIRLFASSLAASTAASSVIRGRPLLPSPYMPGPTAAVPMMPHAPFIPPHPVVGYGPPPGVSAPNYVPLPYSPVTVPEVGSNPLEVRGGTVYFSTDLQKPPTSDVRVGTMYFDPSQQTPSTTSVKSPARRAKSAIPIVDPQVCLAIAVIDTKG